MLILSASLLIIYFFVCFSAKKQRACCLFCSDSRMKSLCILLLSLFSLSIDHCQLLKVENIGLEPMTPCVQGRCSKPTELIPRVLDLKMCQFDNLKINCLTFSNCLIFKSSNFLFCSPRQS